MKTLQAQLATLQAQKSGEQTAGTFALTRTLSRGMSGSDVAALQQFLIKQNLLSSDSATGFFGPLTEAAVKKFQSSRSIVSSGSPATTGYGAVGPRTRSAITSASNVSSTGSAALHTVNTIVLSGGGGGGGSGSNTGGSSTGGSGSGASGGGGGAGGGSTGGGSSGGSGGSGDGGNAIVPEVKSDFIKITRIFGPHDRQIMTENESITPGYSSENSWLILKSPDPNAATVPVYRCGYGYGGGTLSKDKTCPSMVPLDLVGYAYANPAPGRVALRRCSDGNGNGHFVTDYPNCEGTAYHEEEFLGYAYRSLPFDVSVSVSPTVIARGDSLDISWQMSNVTEAQQGRVNKFPNRTIGLTLSPASVSGAFIEEGQITGAPTRDPFPIVFPTTGTKVWKTDCDLTGWCGTIPAGQYQIQAVLFPACSSANDPSSRCGTLEDFLFTDSNVFTIVEPTAPTDLVGSCNASGVAQFTWSPTPATPAGYPIRIQDVASGQIVDHKEAVTGTSYATMLIPGHTYNWWVHAQYESGQSPHTFASSLVTCQ